MDIIGWKGPKIAMKVIKESAKNFTKDARSSAEPQRWRTMSNRL